LASLLPSPRSAPRSPLFPYTTLFRSLPAGQTLDKVISPATLALLNKHTSALGMPAEALKQFKPWMLAMTIEAMEWQKAGFDAERSEEHTSELQSRGHLVCRLLLEKKK